MRTPHPLALMLAIMALLLVATAALANHEAEHHGVNAENGAIRIRSHEVFHEAPDSGEWRTIEGMTTAMTIPGGQQGTILARFNGAGVCTDDAGGGIGNCYIRILIGDEEGHPAGFFRWSSAGGDFGTRSIEQWRGPLPAGTYGVKVQFAAHDSNFHFTNRTLIVERFRNN